MQHLLLLFFTTYSAAAIATLPPGLLNVNAAKTSVEKGKLNGVIFSVGVSTMVLIQAYIAVLISKFLHNNPDVIDLLLKIALGVFAFFAVFFLIKAKKITPELTKTVQVSKRNSFLKGFLLAGVNLLNIPYYSGLNAMWNASGWINFEITDILTFVLAAGFGTFSTLYLYVFYFNKLERKTSKFSENSNYILCVLMVILFVITLLRILYS